MELFTLGASDTSGYPYTETDVREQARALTGWRASYVDDVGYTNFRFDPAYFDNGRRRPSSGRRVRTGTTPAASALEHPAHRRRSSSKPPLELLPSPPIPPKERTARTTWASPGTGRVRLRDPRRRRGDPHAPRPLRRPAMVKPPGGLHRRPCTAHAGGASTPTPWSWISDMAGQTPLPPAQRRAGTISLARHLDVARPLRSSPRSTSGRRPKWHDGPIPGPRREAKAAALNRALKLGPAPASRRSAERPARLGHRVEPALAAGQLEQSVLSGVAPERPAGPDRDVPDQQTS